MPEDRLERVTSLFRAMAGTPEQLIERLKSWEQVGMTYAIVYFAEIAYDPTGLELFASQVIPELA